MQWMKGVGMAQAGCLRLKGETNNSSKISKIIIMDYVFIVEHIYEKNNEEEIKFIGVFSSVELAKDAARFLSDKPGFKDHPFECFKIDKIRLDTFEWKEGFIRWEEDDL